MRDDKDIEVQETEVTDDDIERIDNIVSDIEKLQSDIEKLQKQINKNRANKKQKIELNKELFNLIGKFSDKIKELYQEIINLDTIAQQEVHVDEEKIVDLEERIFNLAIKYLEYANKFMGIKNIDRLDLDLDLDYYFSETITKHLQRVNETVAKLEKHPLPYKIELLHAEIESLIVKWEKFRKYSNSPQKKIWGAEKIGGLILKLKKYTLESGAIEEIKKKAFKSRFKDFESSLELYKENSKNQDWEDDVNITMRFFIGDSENDDYSKDGEGRFIPKVYWKYQCEREYDLQKSIKNLKKYTDDSKHYLEKEDLTAKDCANAKKILNVLTKEHTLWKMHNPTETNRLVETAIVSLEKLIKSQIHEIDIMLEDLSNSDLSSNLKIKQFISTLKKQFILYPSKYNAFEGSIHTLTLLHKALNALKIADILKSTHFGDSHEEISESENALRELLCIDDVVQDRKDAEQPHQDPSSPEQWWLEALEEDIMRLQTDTKKALEKFSEGSLNEFLKQFDDQKYEHLRIEIIASKDKLAELLLQPDITEPMVRQIESEMTKLTSYTTDPDLIKANHLRSPCHGSLFIRHRRGERPLFMPYEALPHPRYSAKKTVFWSSAPPEVREEVLGEAAGKKLPVILIKEPPKKGCLKKPAATASPLEHKDDDVAAAAFQR